MGDQAWFIFIFPTCEIAFSNKIDLGSIKVLLVLNVKYLNKLALQKYMFSLKTFKTMKHFHTTFVLI